MEERKLLVSAEEVTSGVLHGNAGTFRIYIDEPTCGAKKVALLQNTMKAGMVGATHKHDCEHAFFVLSGKATMHVENKELRLVPKSAVFIPEGLMHQIIVDKEEELNVIVLYAPSGPEQKLRHLQAHAFDVVDEK